MNDTISRNRIWFFVLGLCLIALGIAAIAFPFLTTIAVKVFLGWLLLAGGVVQLAHAFSNRDWGPFLFDLLNGAIYAFIGAWLAFFPLTGIIALTLLLAAVFVAQGCIEGVIAFRIRPQRAWTWMVLSGIISVVVGVLIFMSLPSSAAWAIGLLAGINMISSGWAYFFLALAAGSDAGRPLQGS